MGRLDNTNRRRRVSVAPKRVSKGFGNSFKLKFQHDGPLWFLRMCEQHHASRTATFFQITALVRKSSLPAMKTEVSASMFIAQHAPIRK